MRRPIELAFLLRDAHNGASVRVTLFGRRTHRPHEGGKGSPLRSQDGEVHDPSEPCSKNPQHEDEHHRASSIAPTDQPGAAEPLRATSRHSTARIKVNGPHMNRSQALGEAKFMSAPTASTPTSSHVPQLVKLAGKGEAPNPARPRTVSAANTQTPTATSLATRRPVGYCPWCAPPQDAWPRGARPARDLEGRDQDEALSGGDGGGGPGKRGSGQGARHLLRCLGASVHAAASWRTAGVSSAQAMPSQTPANILECGALASLWVFQTRVRWKPMMANTPTRTAAAAASPATPSATVVPPMRLP